MAEMRTSSGAGMFRWPSWQILSTSMLITAMLSAYSVTSATPQCPTAFWNFGDSLTDTGSASNFRPPCAGCSNEGIPTGEAFFGKPVKRASNGRLVTDYFALAFGKPLLQPYLQAGAFDYRFGANFASGGATASNDTTANPIFLAFQVSEFLRLKTTASSEKTQPSCAPFLPFLPLDDSYTKGLYTIGIGANDILLSLGRNKSNAEIVGVVIPEAMKNTAKGIENLYNNGARQFLFFNVPNLGCTSRAITLLGSILPKDSLGCVIAVSQLAQTYNAALNTTIAAARQQYPAGSFATFNYYAAQDEILLNPAKYGFNPNLTKTTCCGAPGLGNLNFNPLVICGNPGSNKCAKPEEYVVWDGVNFTEAFYRVISKFVLNGQFTDSGFNYTNNCNLTFKNFGNVTFDSVYGDTCKVTFVT